MILIKPCPFCFKLCFWNKSMCQFCGNFFAKSELCRKNINGISCSYLMTWSSKNEDLARKIIYGGKQGGEKHIFRQLGRLGAKKLLEKENDQFFCDQLETVVVPSPARDNKKDHAYWIANGFADYLGIEQLDLLERRDTSSQKKKDKVERQKVSLKRKAGASRLIKMDLNYVFVDDVMTSGSTLIAAYSALEKPSHFRGFFLAYKSLLHAH